MSICDNCVHLIICDHDTRTRKSCGCFEERRQQGEWVETDHEDVIYGNYKKCTNCGVAIISTHMSYCGNCGADMRDDWEAVQYPLPLSDGSTTKYRCRSCNTTWDTATPYCPYCGKRKGDTHVD